LRFRFVEREENRAVPKRPSSTSMAVVPPACSTEEYCEGTHIPHRCRTLQSGKPTFREWHLQQLHSASAGITSHRLRFLTKHLNRSVELNAMAHPLSSLSRRLGTAAAVVAAVLILSPTRVAAQLQVATAGDTCASSASETEINDGLQIVSDFRCLTEGGDGCFDGICRYCKSESTDKYPNYVLCEQLAGGIQDFGVSTDPLNSLRDSTRSTPTQNNLGGYGICPSRIGDEELAHGIQLVGDASCGENTDGCFNGQCRYCKYSETTKSSQYVTCNSLGYSFDPASAPVPVSAMSDTAPLPEPVPVDVPASVEPSVLANAPAPGPGPGPDQLPSDPSASVLAPALQPTDTPATLAGTGCPYAVTSGDFDVGIQLVGDASCLAGGGVGCYQNACRYCRFGVPTSQSSGLVSCADLGYSFDAISLTTSRSVPPALALPPSIAVDSPMAATSDPPRNQSGTPAPTQVTNLSTDCAFVVSKGDFAAGIQLVGDGTCAGGGRGCFQDVCRFCKFRNTPQSRHMVPCGDLGYPQFGTPGPTNDSDTGCPYDVSTGDAAVGINLVGDASCATAIGLGCFENVCRYCKEWDTPQSKHLLECADLMAEQTYPPAWRPAEVADPTASTDAIEPAQEPGGVDQTPAPNATDPTVAPVPSNTIPPAVFVVPNTISPAPTKSVRPTRPPLATPKTTRPAATIKPPTVRPVATTKPATTTRPVIATKPLVTVKPKTRAPAATRMGSSGIGCAFAASHSDIAAGVQLVVDTTCARGGIGCFDHSCRYCKFRETKQSKQFVACASLGFHFGSVQSTATTTAVRTHKPTRAPSLPHVATAAPLRSTDCPFVVSDGDFAVGIKLVGDASCANGGLGCFQGVCRYCKFKETPQSAHWVRCAGYTVVPPSVAVAAA
jgi:hypothetical protein